MASIAQEIPFAPSADDRFFVRGAVVMALTIVAGFSFQLAMGRSTFGLPPLVHAHAIVFMGWVAIYLTQNLLIGSGRLDIHRKLGWIALGWIFPMVLLGCLVTLAMLRGGRVPFFFRPLQFLVFDPVTLFFFAGLTIAAVTQRRRTQWHRRLHFCGMSLLLGPAFGRLLPLPLLQPWAWEAAFAATLLFPAAGILADLRRSGQVHPAWRYGVGAMLACLVLTEAITYSPVGTALYRVVTAGSPGAAVPPLDFGSPRPIGATAAGRR
ncbi:MAG: hypothetical protein ABI853_07630 [Sphingomicrobium sp.]